MSEPALVRIAQSPVGRWSVVLYERRVDLLWVSFDLVHGATLKEAVANLRGRVGYEATCDRIESDPPFRIGHD